MAARFKVSQTMEWKIICKNFILQWENPQWGVTGLDNGLLQNTEKIITRMNGDSSNISKCKKRQTMRVINF